MTRLEKCEWYKNKGYTYNSETGKIFGIYGKEIISKSKSGYIHIGGRLYGHHYAWYMTYGNVDFIELDHINTNPSDNRICNLRISNRNQQTQNRNSKGYYWDKNKNKWRSEIVYYGKRNKLGYFNTEEEARNAYLQAKEKYHII
jgi:hypothetical protein